MEFPHISPSILYFKQVNGPQSRSLESMVITNLLLSGGYLVRMMRMIHRGLGYDLSVKRLNRQSIFSIDNRQLKTNQVFTSENFSIRIRVADDEKCFKKNFIIQAIHDPNKDDDNDGLLTTEHFSVPVTNPDSDGDGFSDTSR